MYVCNYQWIACFAAFYPNFGRGRNKNMEKFMTFRNLIFYVSVCSAERDRGCVWVDIGVHHAHFHSLAQAAEGSWCVLCVLCVCLCAFLSFVSPSMCVCVCVTGDSVHFWLSTVFHMIILGMGVAAGVGQFIIT